MLFSPLGRTEPEGKGVHKSRITKLLILKENTDLPEKHELQCNPIMLVHLPAIDTLNASVIFLLFASF